MKSGRNPTYSGETWWGLHLLGIKVNGPRDGARWCQVITAGAHTEEHGSSSAVLIPEMGRLNLITKSTVHPAKGLLWTLQKCQCQPGNVDRRL